MSGPSDTIPAETQNAAGNGVSKTTPVFTTDQLAEVKSFDDMMQLLSDTGIETTEITDFGDGFAVAESKRSLVNVPFVIMDYKFSAKGDFGEFAILRLMTKDGRKLILTDGSTGICEQTRDLARRGVIGGILCPKGLTVSEYDYKGFDSKGNPTVTPAETFYLGM